MAQRQRVAVLRGGPSSEYDISLQTGAAVLNNLNEEKYVPRDIFIDRNGQWHLHGMPKEPGDILQNVDVAFNAMHGEYGEDGHVQKILDRYGVPYTGSRASASALCINKLLTKEALRPYLQTIPLLFAKHAVVEPGIHLEDQLEAIFEQFNTPLVVKPVIGGSSVGVAIVSTYDELYDAVEDALERAPRAFVEEYVEGKEATVGVLEKFRGEDIYALLPIEIIPAQDHTFFDYDAKYHGASQEICPGRFSLETKEQLQMLAARIHQLLGLRHYSRSDFIVTPQGIYFLEINTLPGLTEESLVPKALKAVGCSFPDFLDHLVTLASSERMHR